MREKSSVVSLFLTRAGFVEFFVVFVKLVHGLTAIFPPLVLALFLDPMAPEMRSHFLGLLLFFCGIDHHSVPGPGHLFRGTVQ